MSAEGPKLARELHEKHGKSPQEIDQLIIVLKNKKHLLNNVITDLEKKLRLQAEIIQIQDDLKKVVTSYGGLVVINAWLIEHEGHYEKDNIYQFDWSFLED